MNILDLIYRYDQWGMRQNHAGCRNSDKFDDPNLLLISVGHEAESCRPYGLAAGGLAFPQRANKSVSAERSR